MGFKLVSFIFISLVFFQENSCSKDTEFFDIEIRAPRQNISNYQNFDFILNPEQKICQHFSASFRLKLLIYVHTSPSNFKRRLSIRETWAKRSMFNDTRLVFMMGYTSDSKTNHFLKLESNIYQDIVQQKFIDSYRNLTYKCIMSLHWINLYCSNVNYIIKTDDDVILNTFELISYIEKLNLTKNFICNGWKNVKVNRNLNYKWYVSYSEYSNEYFKDYCCGFAFLFTGDLVPLLYEQTFLSKFFWIDDYYMTGELAHKINATLEFQNKKFILDYTRIEKSLDEKILRNTLAIHLKGDSKKEWYFWQALMKFYLKI